VFSGKDFGQMKKYTSNQVVWLAVAVEIELTPQHPQLLSERGTEQETEVAHFG
jgi:hypothetical protein